MKYKIKKAAVALLAAACISFGATGLTACKKDDAGAEDDKQIVAVYNSYVAYTQSNGETPLTYDEWLSTIKGENGANGTNGTNGTDGASWLTGSTAPAATDGKVGDLYLDTATYDIYKKGAEGWTKIGNIKGESGANGTNGTNGVNGTNGTNGTDGASWLTGATAPAATDGKVGDLYLNTATYDIYKKGADGWSTIGNIKGADGQGSDTVSVVDVDAERITVDGVDYLNLTLTLSDGKTVERQVELPAGTTAHQASKIRADYQIVPINTPSEELENMIMLDVTYSDNSYGHVSIAEADCDLSVIDLNTVGLYTVTGTYGGVSFTLKVAVCDFEQDDESVTVLGYVCESVEISMGISESELPDRLKYTYVTEIKSNGSTEGGVSLSELGVTDEQIEQAITTVDPNTAGTYTVNLTYGEYEIEITVEVIDYNEGEDDSPQEAQLIMTLSGEDTKSSFAYNGDPISQIELYSDGSAKLLPASSAAAASLYTDDGQDVEVVVDPYITAEYEFVVADGAQAPEAIKITSAGICGAIYGLDFENAETGGDARFTDYAFTGEPVETMTGATSDGKNFTLKVYDNGMAEMIVDDNTYNVGVTRATVTPTEGESVTYVQIPGVEYFTLNTADEENPSLAPIVSDASDSEQDSICGVWSPTKAEIHYSGGQVSPYTNWGLVLLTVKSDHTAIGIEIHDGELFKIVFSWEEGSDLFTVTEATVDGVPIDELPDWDIYDAYYFTLEGGILKYKGVEGGDYILGYFTKK